MKIVFSTLEEWAKELMKKHLSDHDLVFIDEPLSMQNIDQYIDADILVVFIDSKIDREIIDKLPNLKFIATMSTGFDHIDIITAKEYGIIVSNVPRYGSNTVAEHSFALLLAITKQLIPSIQRVQQGHFSPKGLRGMDLKGKTIGVLGVGNIGRNVIRIAHGFGMNILAYDIYKDKDLEHQLGFKYVDLDTLLSNSDIISIHLPLTQETRHLINMSNINKLKKGVIIINTARGAIIDSNALLYGLDTGIIQAAGLDVLEGEKEIKEEAELLKKGKINYKLLAMDYILIHHPKVIVTPHNAFNTKEAVERIVLTTIDNIKGFLNHRPINRVN